MVDIIDKSQREEISPTLRAMKGDVDEVEEQDDSTILDLISQPRLEIANELEREFESYCAKWDNMTPVIKETNYEARTCKYGDSKDIMVNIMKSKIPGAKIEQFRNFISDPTQVSTALNARLTAERLRDDGGCQVYHLIYDSPFKMFVTNRSTILTYYQFQKENDNSLRIMSSSRGNERITAAVKDKIGKNVVTNYINGYAKITPVEDGVEFVDMICHDLKGTMPQFIKKVINNRTASNGKWSVDYIVTGKVPDQV